MQTALIHGTTDPKFKHLRDVFASNFADGLERGAGVSVVIDGKPLVHLWGGHANAARDRPWTDDTLVNVWSVSKGVMALAIAMLVERNRLRYDQPIADVWPEFGANGKAQITLEQVLSHSAGLNGLSVDMDETGLLAWTPYVDALAAMAPLWEPGSLSVYHALSYGHLAGEVLRRVDGRRVSRFVQDEISRRVGAAFFIGVPDAEDHLTAEMVAGPKASDWVEVVLNSNHPQACRNPTPLATSPNSRAWRKAEVPGGNGHCTALGLATIYGRMVGGASPLLSSDTLQHATHIRFDGTDPSMGVPCRWGAGFSLREDAYGKRASSGSFGHGGWGGALGFADPAARLGFAYVTNHMLGFDDGVDPRRARLIDAVYDAL